MYLGIILALLAVSAYANSTDDDQGRTVFRQGDARACLDIARKNNFPLFQFSALPGVGWDNLRNTEAGQVIDWNYMKCKTTEDGRFLLPDSMFTIPIKTSLVELYAEMFDSWSTVTSTTSRGVNVNAGLNYKTASISGSFSHEMSKFRSTQSKENTVATRVQLRYLRYKSRVQPDAPLHPTFKTRLLSIARDLDANKTQSAFYKSQLLIRDYGTHVLTSITAGAGLEKTDFLKRSFVESNKNDTTKITASASASFGQVFNMKTSFSQSTGSTEDKGYKSSVTNSYVSTHGGPIMRPFNMTLNEWVEGVDADLVPMDRSGDPISFLITAESLPDLPAPLVDAVEKNVRDAIDQYYSMNTIPGCTKRGAPNFSFSANFNDSTCDPPKTNLTFGGTYQTCAVQGSFLRSNPCDGLAVMNPMTQKQSCAEGFTAVHLHRGTKLGKREVKTTFKACGLLGLQICHHYTYYQALAVYNTYWCAANKQVPQGSGYLFGGIYSSTSTNLVTRAKKCPSMYYPRRILSEHFICLSDDYELAQQRSVPFAGFTSCDMGNPLSIPPEISDNSNHSLRDWFRETSKWPKRCPHGFSQHLATIENNCNIHYCIQTGAVAGEELPIVKRPPFISKPPSILKSDVYMIVNSMANNSFIGGRKIVSKYAYDQAINMAGTTQRPTQRTSQGSTDGGDASAHILPSVAITVLCAFLGWQRF